MTFMTMEQGMKIKQYNFACMEGKKKSRGFVYVQVQGGKVFYCVN
jgi:hypothetical protein